jgi:hypothetical protein
VVAVSGSALDVHGTVTSVSARRSTADDRVIPRFYSPALRML